MIPTPHRAYLIARTEVLQTKRSIEDSSSRLVAMLFSAVFFLLLGIAAVIGAYFFGTTLGGIGGQTSLRIASGAAAGIFGFPVLFTAIRMVQKVPFPETTDGLLTTVPHRDAVAGIILAEMAKMIGIPVVFVLGAAVVFGIGAGSVTSVVLFAFSVLSLGLLGMLFGFVIGFIVLNLLARSPVLARYRMVIGALLFLVYISIFIVGPWESVIEPLVQAVSTSPLGWFGDLALLAVVADASTVQAVAAGLISALGIPAAVAGCNWLAAQLWYTHPVEPAADEEEPSRMGDISIGSIGSVPRPMTRVIRKTWLRARRSPIRLMYVLYPLLGLIDFIIIESGSVSPVLPALIALYGAWATGAAFTLNPIGDEGPVLPITLTSSITGRTFVNALCLAGLVIGIPVTVIAVVVTGVIASLSITSLVGVVVMSVVLCLCATAIATGAGVAFPRLEPARITRGRKAIVPSLFAFALFSLVLIVVSVPAMLGLIPAARDLLTDLVGFGTQTLAVGGLVGTIVLGGIAGAISYISAVGSFNGYYYD
jgi:ABC-2 type transport system permease protein